MALWSNFVYIALIFISNFKAILNSHEALNISNSFNYLIYMQKRIWYSLSLRNIKNYVAAETDIRIITKAYNE